MALHWHFNGISPLRHLGRNNITKINEIIYIEMLVLVRLFSNLNSGVKMASIWSS